MPSQQVPFFLDHTDLILTESPKPTLSSFKNHFEKAYEEDSELCFLFCHL